jgi:hypothetical protein
MAQASREPCSVTHAPRVVRPENTTSRAKRLVVS